MEQIVIYRSLKQLAKAKGVDPRTLKKALDKGEIVEVYKRNIRLGFENEVFCGYIERDRVVL